MATLTDTEKSKAKFFVEQVILISDYLLDEDYDSFTYAKIQDAIADCETAFNAIGSTALETFEEEVIDTEVSAEGFGTQNKTTTYTKSLRVSSQERYATFYNAVDNLISVLGYVYR